jgi:S-adenosylmethionine synthetase
MRIEIELGKDLPPDEYAVESVEREGTGHLDTLRSRRRRFSVALCKHYLEHYELILHQNVDKTMLSAER